MAKHLPNIVTSIRFVLIPLLLYLLVVEDFYYALYLLLIMGLTDALDGFLAKQMGWVSRLGEFFDPLCDKLMLVSTVLVLAFIDLLPVWLVVLIVARDIIIVTGGVAYHYYITQFRAAPSIISKWNTLSQLVLVAVVIYAQINPAIEQTIPWFIALVTLTTLWSGIGYVVEWGMNARKMFISNKL